MASAAKEWDQGEAMPAQMGLALDREGDRRSPTAAPKLQAEFVTARTMIGYQPAWSDLAARPLEPNVFLDPAFALPLLQHVRFAKRPDFLLVWEEDGPTSFGRLVGLLPLVLPRWRFAQGLRHPQVALGLPLLDAARGLEAFAAMMDWLGRRHPRLTGLMLAEIPSDGAFSRALRASGRFAVTVLGERQRAVLRHDSMPAAAAPLSAKRRKELRRQRRRLAECGALRYRSARLPEEIKRAAEQFMAMEGNGWKGRRGSALLFDPTLATFTRTMTRLMAHEGRCRIDSIEIDGKPVAMGILVMAGARAHFWKTTFDERFAPLSPGVQFALDLTQAQVVEPGLTLTDSCAVPDHPMIDRIWGDRIVICDLVVAVPAADPRSWRFRRAIGLEVLRRRARRTVKTMVRAALGWRGSAH